VGAVFGVCLLSAIVASVLIHLLGWYIGVPVAAATIWVAAIWPRYGIGYRLFRILRLDDIPVEEPLQPMPVTA
jgi:phosphate/sulfate permease